MNLKDKIAGEVQSALKAVYNLDADPGRIQIQATSPDFEGTYTFVIFAFIKQIGGNPVEIGTKLGEYLVDHSDVVQGFNVVKGFLNMVISNATWLEIFSDLQNMDAYEMAERNGKTMMVEFASPNTNKPLHLGHLRNIFLGDSVSSILDVNGYDVVRTQIINDRGIHICKSMLAWKRYGNGETPTADIKGDKLVGNYYVRFDQEYKKEIAALIAEGKSEDEAKQEAPVLLEAQEMLKKWEAGDEEVTKLWRTMNGWVYDGFDVTYNSLQVSFDKLYYESDTYLIGRDEVLKGLEQGVFYKKEDGSVWVDLEAEKLDQKLLLRKDGTSVYMTQDIGTAILRFKDYPTLAGQVYTVGNEQEYHFKVLFAILKKLGFSWAEACYHLSYGMVELPSGKMKSREGTVVDADDLIEEMIGKARERTREKGKIDALTEEQAEELYHMIALGALKYYLLRVDPKRGMMFNPEESVDFQGNTGPFIQYTHARIASLQRDAEEQGVEIFDVKQTGFTSDMLESEEGEIICMLNDFPDAVLEAGRTYQPSVIANYVFELTRSFNSYYAKHKILKETDEMKRSFRIAFSAKVGEVIRKSMNLLGIQVPDRM